MPALLANAGSPLIWFSCFHLLVGNFFIGLGEAWLIQRLFCAPARRAKICVIAANYVSAFAGIWVVPASIEWLCAHAFTGPRVLFLRALLFSAMGIAIALTVLLEWPFFAAAFRGQSRWLRKSVLGTLVAQAASYAVIVPIWFVLSDLSGAWLERRALPDFAPASPVFRVYYIEPTRGDICSIRIDGTEPQVLAPSAVHDSEEEIVGIDDPNEGGWDLLICKFPSEGEPRAALCGLQGRHASMTPPPVTDWKHEENVILPARFEGFENRGRSVAYPWAWGGLYLSQEDADVEFRMGLHTPMLSRGVQNATLLPSGHVVLDTGDDEIIVVDPRRRLLGFLAAGRSPVVAMEPAPPTTQPDGE